VRDCFMLLMLSMNWKKIALRAHMFWVWFLLARQNIDAKNTAKNPNSY
jgi:hypothetical protein